MGDDATKRQGDRVKRYVRVKWRGPGGAEEVERLGRLLDPGVRARVDAIGMDDQELLHVPDQSVLARLGELEREAEHELTRALNGARVLRRKRANERADNPQPVGRHRRVRRG